MSGAAMRWKSLVLMSLMSDEHVALQQHGNALAQAAMQQGGGSPEAMAAAQAIVEEHVRPPPLTHRIFVRPQDEAPML